MIIKKNMKLSDKLGLLLSVNKRIPIKDLEISAVRICPVRCEYCPQSSLIEASKGGINSKTLKFEDFKNYLLNISMNTTLHWTGYSESLANRNFPEMVDYAFNLGYKQSISTTLSGHRRSVEYLYSTNAFKQITLHLPDEDGLMTKGALKIDDNYIKTLREFFVNHHNLRGSMPVYIVCYGEKINKSLQKVINEFQEKINIILTKTQSIHTRGGLVKNLPGFFKNAPGLKTTKSLIRYTVEFLLKIMNIELNIYRCSYFRLNQPVLMGDGDLYICCMDYGLKCNTGNISDGNLNNIFSKWFLENKKDFINGSLEPCTSCEYYNKIKIKDIIKYIYRKFKSKINS